MCAACVAERDQQACRGSKHFRKTLGTKSVTLAYEAWLKTKVLTTPEWQPTKRDLRRLSELVDIWYEHHGANLRAGQDT